MRLSIPLLAALLAAGCTTTLPADRAVVDPYVPVVPEVQMPSRAVTGSIFMDQNGSRLFGHKREFSVGDVVTVVLTESTQAQRRSGLEATKEGNNATLKGLQALLKNPLNTPFAAQDFDNLAVETKGFGTANQAAARAGRAARVRRDQLAWSAPIWETRRVWKTRLEAWASKPERPRGGGVHRSRCAAFLGLREKLRGGCAGGASK